MLCCKSAQKLARDSKLYHFQAFGLHILQSYGQEQYSVQKKKKANGKHGISTSFSSAADGWLFTFSTSTGNNVGNAQGNEDTSGVLPAFWLKLIQNEATLPH